MELVNHAKDAIQSMAHELQLCGDAFGPEIALFAPMHKLAKSGLGNDEVWSQITDTPRA